MLNVKCRLYLYYLNRSDRIDDRIFSLQDYRHYIQTKEAKRIEHLKEKATAEIKKASEEKIKSLIEKNEKTIESLRVQKAKIQEKMKLYAPPEAKVVLPEDVILRVDQLSMHFGGLKAVNDLSFDVKKGEIFGLIGPNGAGKTTVFNCITQFYKPTHGHIYYVDKLGGTVVLNHQAVHNVIRKGIVRTFQNVELIWELTILENLLVAAHTHFHTGILAQFFRSRSLRVEEEVMREKAMKILHSLGLTAYAFAYPVGLPYGILKKIEFARTLMGNPKLIILDEPAAGLNDHESEELADIIKVIQKEYDVTIFLVEHDMDLVMKICDTICAISFGKKLAVGTPKEIQSNPVVQEAYLGGE